MQAAGAKSPAGPRFRTLTPLPLFVSEITESPKECFLCSHLAQSLGCTEMPMKWPLPSEEGPSHGNP